MTVPSDAVFELRLTKHAGDSFRVALDADTATINERDAVLMAIDLLILHLENQAGMRSWDAGVAEGLRRTVEP